ncbi:quinone-dependent dihydroorotate dehydrogenase [Sphingomonas ginkgonis]|uniref:Dihydroorotate dehydrogenase (quinone) n=1 Tax=Sphingomonas ginkgonis TaxID=2315330 RepID=A0A429V6T9_9SPHN|nr:quinone-dependent dihydroorotate dehydrogenase [Sphingomonas ginkgonis]RST29654.1 quinone-dependent dihydroorotate dehydrogenase [Sphingomonas ginkgonis]
MALYPLLRPFVFRLDAEQAHRATIAALKLRSGTGLTPEPASTPRLGTRVAGLDFLNPIGLAAGFDKDAEVFGPMLNLGFGFVEVGTLTPKPQAGNGKPRLFRLVEDRAVINRFGFNNRGQIDALQRLKARRRGSRIVGVNIGANKDSIDRIADYSAGVREMSSVADYLTVNISSPNTPGLRQLQDEGAVRDLLAAVRGARAADGPPIFLKVAPDLGEQEPRQIVRAALDQGIDGLIVSNTTVSRPPLRSRHALESGGLSGAPLRSLALDALRRFRAETGGQLPLIGVGGIASADDAWERIRAGADLVQLYSALVYEGPGLARRILADLERRLDQAGLANIAEAVASE